MIVAASMTFHRFMMLFRCFEMLGELLKHSQDESKDFEIVRDLTVKVTPLVLVCHLYQ